LAGSKRQRRSLLVCSGSILLTTRECASCLVSSERGRFGMASREATFVTRKAEDRPAEPEGTGAYASLYTQGQNHREKGTEWKAVPPSNLTVVTWKVITMT